MELLNIISAEKKKDSSIVLTIANPESGAHETRHFADIRLGLHWPTTQSPACFVAVGQKYTGSPDSVGEKVPVGKREVIAEYICQSIGLTPFYLQITNFAKKTLCHNLYAVLPEDQFNFGHLRDFEAFAKQSECSIYVHSASEQDDFLLSVFRVRDSIDNGSLAVPKNTAVFDQLKVITREDLLDSPEERFYCIDALGNVLDGFYRWPPRNYPLIDKRRRPPDWRYH